MSDGPRSINDLVVRCLCQKHNSELSPLDIELIDLINSFREIERLRQVRRNVHIKYPTPTRFVLNGLLLERCLLKMVMTNAIFQKQHLEGWQPPDWLPEVVLGQRPLPEGCGMSMLVRLNDQIDTAETISFAFGRSEAGVFNCAMLELRKGWRFYCTWDEPLKPNSIINVGDERYDRRDILFHARRADFVNTPTEPIGVSLNFEWSGSCPAGLKRNVIRLRPKFRAPPRPGSKKRRGA